MSALSVAAFTFGGCDDDDEVVYNGTDKVALDMPQAVETGATYVTLSTPFHVQRDAHWTQVGYCVSQTGTPTVHDIVYKAETPEGMAFGGVVYDGAVTATIPSLVPGTEYHVRAYAAQYQGSVVYSPEYVFTTSDGTLDEQLANYRGPEYADDY